MILALVADKTVAGLIAPAAEIAGQQLRHVKMRIGHVSLERPGSRKALPADVAEGSLSSSIATTMTTMHQRLIVVVVVKTSPILLVCNTTKE